MGTTQPRRLSGRLSSGAELGKGTRWHAVDDAEMNFGKALCGAEPGRLSGVGWMDRVGAEVTCPRCLQRLRARAMRHSAEEE